MPLMDRGKQGAPGASAAETAGAPAQAVLFALAYDELKRIAHRARRDSPRAETIDTTALVHEVFLKIRVRDEAQGAGVAMGDGRAGQAAGDGGSTELHGGPEVQL